LPAVDADQLFNLPQAVYGHFLETTMPFQKWAKLGVKKSKSYLNQL
jgi:hypothetical protein